MFLLTVKKNQSIFCLLNLLAYLLAVVTAYTPECTGCSGITASGAYADPAKRYLAADKFWPFGTKIALCFPNGEEYIYTVVDRGSKIKGKNRFDILVSSEGEASEWGVKTIHYRVIE